MGKGAKPKLNLQFQDLFGGAHAFVQEGTTIGPSQYLAARRDGSYGVAEWLSYQDAGARAAARRH